VDANGGKLFGACFWMFTNAGGGVRGNFVISFCPGSGRAQVDGLVPGSYLIDQIKTDPGYISYGQKAVTISGGVTLRIKLKNLSGGSSVSAKTVDSQGTRLKGACYRVYRGKISNSSPMIADYCDADDGKSDGYTHLYGLGLGSNTLWEGKTPDGYTVPTSTFALNVQSSGVTLRPTITNYPVEGPDSVVVTKQDEATNLLPGACLSIFLDPGTGRFGSFVTSVCDGNDGGYDGKVAFSSVAPGNYFLHESRSPLGYQIDVNLAFTKVAGQAKALTIHDQPGGTKLLVKAVDIDSGVALPGACWQVHHNDGNGGLGNFVAGGCDGGDGYGANDGTFQVLGLPSGSYVLYQGTPPNGYQQATKRSFNVNPGQTTRTITVKFRPVSAAAASQATPSATPSASASPVSTVGTTVSPTTEPTAEPTLSPTEAPTLEPAATETPTAEPTVTETPEPTSESGGNPEGSPESGS
jgi:uncharacterized surface anchored protein